MIHMTTGFRFIFYRAHGHKNVHEMSKSKKAVYDLLCECDCFMIAELVKRIGKTDKMVCRAIKALKENGYIVREGTDTSGYWKILKQLNSIVSIRQTVRAFLMPKMRKEESG